MDSERWKQVDRLLHAAGERPPGERAKFLRQACAGDAELEREVQSLLASQQEAGSFLESPAMEVAARAMALNQEDSASLAGQAISHYRIIEKLGEGGMGVVWKARDSRLDRFVALKLLPAARMSDPDRKRRFVQEAKTVSALNHPHIITIYDIDHADGVDFIAMEFVPGKALVQSIPRKGLRLDEALRYAIEVADALAAAHAAGIVHRDLKPGNIMVHENGSVKVLDFGLAKLTEQGGSREFARTETIAEAAQTYEGMIVGTAAYMSPEQAEGKKVDARSDIFSFGAVLYEMLTGRRAFSGDSMLSILSAILRDEPQPAAEIIQGLPREVGRIVQRCLRKDPVRRYQHAGDLKIDLQQVREDLGSVMSPLSPERSRLSNAKAPLDAQEPAPRRRRVLAPVLAALATAAVALAASWLYWRAPRSAPDVVLTRVTSDAGLTTDPALSSDGKLIAYASERAGDGGLDIWIQQVGSGESIRLTRDPTDDHQPHFSPDGTRIVFRSERDGGGVYVVPVLGGEARLVAAGGFDPQFSPDGQAIAYWTGLSGSALPASIWIASVSGGMPRRVLADFPSIRSPRWSPDGKFLRAV